MAWPAAMAGAASPLGLLRGPQQVLRGDGQVLEAPKVQLVRLGDTPMGPQLQQFLHQWRDSKAWGAMTAEYGVGALTVLAAQHMPSPFAGPVLDVDDDSGETEDSAVELLLGRLVAERGAAAAKGTVYVFMLPTGLAASPSSDVPDACAAHIWAWHSATSVGEGPGAVTVPYVVLPDCGGSAAMAAIDRKTAALSHALVQAVTNPTSAAVAGVDAHHVATDLLAEESELGTLCTQALHGSASWLARPADMNFAVARVWSNVASRAGQAPCVPADANEAFFHTDVALSDGVTAQLAGGSRTVATVGVSLAAGAQTQVALHWLGTGAGAGEGAWRTTVEEVGSHDLTLTLDKDCGRAGEQGSLGVRLAAEPAHGQQVVRITARRGRSSFSNYFLVRQKSEAP